jgi:hypothetical protein
MNQRNALLQLSHNLQNINMSNHDDSTQPQTEVIGSLWMCTTQATVRETAPGQFQESDPNTKGMLSLAFLAHKQTDKLLEERELRQHI